MTEQKKKTVAIVHLQHGVERFVFDSRQFHHESWHYALENVAVAIVPTTAFVRFEDWKEKKPLTLEDIKTIMNNTPITHSETNNRPPVEIYSGVPNEHNMGERVVIENHEHGGKYKCNVELFIGDELTVYTESGDSCNRTVTAKFVVTLLPTIYYFNEPINTNLTWYITKRLHQQA